MLHHWPATNRQSATTTQPPTARAHNQPAPHCLSQISTSRIATGRPPPTHTHTPVTNAAPSGHPATHCLSHTSISRSAQTKHTQLCTAFSAGRWLNRAPSSPNFLVLSVSCTTPCQCTSMAAARREGGASVADGVAVNDRVWRQQQQQGGRVVRQADDAAAAVAGPSSRAGGQPRGRLCSPAHLREVCSVNPSDADCKLQGAAQLLQRGADRGCVARGCAGLGLRRAGGRAGGTQVTSTAEAARSAMRQSGRAKCQGCSASTCPGLGGACRAPNCSPPIENKSDVHVG